MENIQKKNILKKKKRKKKKKKKKNSLSFKPCIKFRRNNNYF